MSTNLPARYQLVSELGRGGGGQVWAVIDRLTGITVALKALSEGANEREMQSLVREAVTLSGLEGLGVPRVLRFGRLPSNGRAYMVRELVEGQSLLFLIENCLGDPSACLNALARAADQLTGLHRAGLLHGDIKPANIIVGTNHATLVDLGLCAPWREGGSRPEGLTPRYAAPELFLGLPLTVRAEIFAIGATLEDILEHAEKVPPENLELLRAVVARATDEDPARRFPSADELASTLRHAARIPSPAPARLNVDASWAVLGVDNASNLLLSRIATLPQGSVLAIEGKYGSGRSSLVRRAAWSLGVEGRDVAWIEHLATLPMLDAIEIELSACAREDNCVVLVDNADRLAAPALERLKQARKAGAKLAIVASADCAAKLGGNVERFEIPPLEERTAKELVRRAIPSLSDTLVAHVIDRSEGRPGRLRTIVRRLGHQPVVTTADVDRLIEGPQSTKGLSLPQSSDLQDVEALLDQGRFEEAASRITTIPDAEPIAHGLCLARLALGRGNASEALAELQKIAELAKQAGSTVLRRWNLQASRANLRLGRYADSAQFALDAIGNEVTSTARGDQNIRIEARACLGLVSSYLGKHDEAEKLLHEAAEEARNLGDRRTEALALGSLAIALQRADKLKLARRAYEETLDAAEAAGDAGAVANTRLNLAGLAQGEGDIAGAIKHLEAAVDMGRRAGRGSTTRQALLNLASLDIYLGRYARARSSIETLSGQREQLAAHHRAQLVGLEAEVMAATGELPKAVRGYELCATAYEALGRDVDAAEARLEGVLTATRAGEVDAVDLSRNVEQAMKALTESTSHRALLGLVKGALAAKQGDEERAKEAYDEALSAAKAAGQKEWIWRTLDARSQLLLSMGQGLAARKDAEEALGVLEDIAARLPRDLREVYWDDQRRRNLRKLQNPVMPSSKAASVTFPKLGAATQLVAGLRTQLGSSSTVPQMGVEERLALLLEINKELSREHSLPRLLEKVTDQAIALLNAERGFVILDRDGSLVVHTSRDRQGDEAHATFSTSIAEKAIATGEPVVTLSALDDERMAGFLSVHQLNVQSVACVPIHTPQGRAIGALYLETRVRPGMLFHTELPTLIAFADQAAIAIENAHLIEENQIRADELAKANEELKRAHDRLEELLGHRTAQLESTRRDLKSTRAVLRGHFGYQGLVGTSDKMRRVYALIDRLKDMDVPVLITGESGTGKEVVARAIHSSGARAKNPFTGINCGAIPENLLESELFGHVKGAFTGADKDRKGLFRETQGGTILLDEIGEMPHKMQAGLLRVLQENLVRPVGGIKEEPVSARVIAATHRSLEKMVADGAFREDLFYRLHVVELFIPPLRERSDDIPVLIDHFLQIFAARYRRERKTISREALRFLSGCPWPGNVRQLENSLLNAWVMSDRSELVQEDFELSGLRRSSPVPRDDARVEAPGQVKAEAESSDLPKIENLEEHEASEKERILEALTACNWNRVKAAETVGMPRRTFYRRLAKHGIQ